MSRPRTPLIISTLACTLALTLAQSVLADKDKSGKAGKDPWQEQKQYDKQKTHEAREQYPSERDGSREREELRERKTEQEQRELGKGSEQGQQGREEHSRKWWKFWE